MNKKLIEKNFPIIEYILRNKAVSRVELANTFGYNRMTTSNIVSRLEEANAVIEIDSHIPCPMGAGRPSTQLVLNGEFAYFIGINFNSSDMTAAVIDFSGKILFEDARIFPAHPDKRDIIEIITESIHFLLSKVEKKKVIAIGIGVPGTVDPANGIGKSYKRLANWDNVPLAELLQIEFRIPVFIDHNCSCNAIGEAFFGVAVNFNSTVVIMISVGISMGIVYQQKILRLSSVSSGELGHMRLGKLDKKCWCGNDGCLETGISGWLLSELLPEKLKSASADEIDKFIASADDNNPEALAIIVPMFEYLGNAIVDLARLLRPETVIIDGIFNHAPKLMQNEIAKCLETRGKSLNGTAPKVIISSAEFPAGAVGAAAMACCRYFEVANTGLKE